jgi:hypothetical protein
VGGYEEEEESRLRAYNGAAADGDALLPNEALFSLIRTSQISPEPQPESRPAWGSLKRIKCLITRVALPQITLVLQP